MLLNNISKTQIELSRKKGSLYINFFDRWFLILVQLDDLKLFGRGIVKH